MERVALVMRVKEGEEEYGRRHQQVWPAVLADLERAGVRSMSIFMADLELFLYIEVEDYAAAARILAQSPESVRWEEYMAPIMQDESGDAYDPYDAYPEGLPEVFHWRVSDARDVWRHTLRARLGPLLDFGKSRSTNKGFDYIFYKKMMSLPLHYSCISYSVF